eukprot:c19906_g1_i1 orf=232-1224(+)
MPPRVRLQGREDTACRAGISEKPDQSDERDELSLPSRRMEDLWKEAFPVGTEWDQYERVYEINWDFSNLERAFDEGGKLYGERVYLFGCTEPQLVDYKSAKMVIYVPAVVAVVSPVAPSDKVGIKSIQMEGETIVSMRKMKMDWVPYIPRDVRDTTAVERYKTQIFTLKCEQRRVALKNLKQEQIKKYEYCLPYFSNPMKEEEELPDTVVDIFYSIDDEHPPVVADFDWELDDIEEFTDNLIQEEQLPPEEKEKFQEFVKQCVRSEKKKQREVKEKRKKEIAEMSPETKDAYENMRFYKFYPVPSPDAPDICDVKVPFINRYYGKAVEVL